MRHFPRILLAQELAQGVQGQTLWGDTHNGLFLAAPRRTGKSTFLQSDLKPELEKQGLVVVYVDLWSDQRRDPAELISDAIGRALQPYQGLLAKVAKASGVDSVSIGGAVTIDVSKIGRRDGATLTDALRALHETAERPVVLIIDEAQHALTSEAGEIVMSALKAARDQLNTPDRISLMLIMSGSDRDKLLRLVNSNSAPFYGSQIRRMPELDRDFIAHIARLIEKQRADLHPVDEELLMSAFVGFGRRPQFFMAALEIALGPFNETPGRFEHAVLAAAQQRQRDDEAQMEAEYLSLSALQRAVLWRLLEQASRFRPYDAEALRFYHHRAGQKVTAQKVQNALEGLRQRTPSMVWKSARGEYAVDDAAMHHWYQQRLNAGTWPPVDHLDGSPVE